MPAYEHAQMKGGGGGGDDKPPKKKEWQGTARQPRKFKAIQPYSDEAYESLRRFEEEYPKPPKWSRLHGGGLSALNADGSVKPFKERMHKDEQMAEIRMQIREKREWELRKGNERHMDKLKSKKKKEEVSASSRETRKAMKRFSQSEKAKADAKKISKPKKKRMGEFGLPLIPR